MNDLDICLEVV